MRLASCPVLRFGWLAFERCNADRDDIVVSSSPRGWHLSDPRLLIDGVAVSGSILDFALYFFHNAHELVKRGFGPYFYLPKMEHYLEARYVSPTATRTSSLSAVG